MSHLRFGKKPIKSTYLIHRANFVACHNPSYIRKYNMVQELVDGGTFLLNCPWTQEELEEHLPGQVKAYIANHNIKFYIINGVKIGNAQDYQDYIKENPLTGDPVELTYTRDGLEYHASITPKEYRTADSGFTYNIYCQKAKGLDVIRYGAVEVKYMIRTTVLSLKELCTGKLGVKDLSGPVGVVDAIGTTYEQSKSEGTVMLWMNMLNMAVLLSANLGVMNLLPFPALDGGRLVFLVVEAVRRKPINRQIEGMVHFAGLMLLMVLMVVVMYNDIVRIF